MAKFSKAHYVALAKVLRDTEEVFGEFDDCYPYEVLSELRGNLGNMLAKDNPKFDRDRFLKASEPEINR